MSGGYVVGILIAVGVVAVCCGWLAWSVLNGREPTHLQSMLRLIGTAIFQIILLLVLLVTPRWTLLVVVLAGAFAFPLLYHRQTEALIEANFRCMSRFQDPASSYVPVGGAQLMLVILLVVSLANLSVGHVGYFFAGVVIDGTYVIEKLQRQVRNQVRFWGKYRGSRPLVFVADDETEKSIRADHRCEETAAIYPDFEGFDLVARPVLSYAINLVASTLVYVYLPLVLSTSDNNMSFVLNSISILFVVELDDLSSTRVYAKGDPE